MLWHALRRPRRRRGPLVSVVIATYNWSNVLRHAIRSALGQSYEDVEVIVVGDGCTDDTEAMVTSWGDPRVRWIGLAENSGSQSAPNNAGVAAARGTYVAYHGHDDVWHPDHLALVVGAMERTGAGFGYARAEMIGPPETHIRVITEGATGGLPASVMVHRRELHERIGGWRDYRTIVDPPDNDFHLRAAGTAAAVAEVPALTVFKFNSAWRRNSYVEKPDHEQAAYLERLARTGPRRFVVRELVAVLRLHLTGPPPRYPAFAPPPAPDTPGWSVTQWRRHRGLE